MTPEQFCYWLRGFFELLEAGPKTADKLVLTKEQVEMIDKHLKSVFQEKIMTVTYPSVINPLYIGPNLPPQDSTVICGDGVGTKPGSEFIC